MYLLFQMKHSSYANQYSVKITGFSKEDGQILMRAEPHWWDARELVSDNRFIETRRNQTDYDYDADLSLEELRELHERYKRDFTRFHKWLCFKFGKLAPSCKKLQKAMTYRSYRYSHFHVTISERESGL